MELPEAKQKFIEAWGKLGSEWGVNRTMAQVHALLLVSAGGVNHRRDHGIVKHLPR